MKGRNSRRSLAMIAALSALLFDARTASATIVEFQTNLGNFEVNLYDNTTPLTVANFLAYVNNGAYSNAVIHRSVPDFVIQGGGYTFNRALPLEEIAENPPVRNEPALANVRGTIGMARPSGQRNGATNQWFFNLDDNSASLDWRGGGYTVFGEVVGDGMDVVDAIAALPLFDVGSPIDAIPLRNYTSTDLANNVAIGANHLVIITAVVIADSTVDSSAQLEPTVNMATAGPPPPVFRDVGSGGRGASGILPLLGLIVVIRRRLRGRASKDRSTIPTRF